MCWWKSEQYRVFLVKQSERELCSQFGYVLLGNIQPRRDRCIIAGKIVRLDRHDCGELFILFRNMVFPVQPRAGEQLGRVFGQRHSVVRP